MLKTLRPTLLTPNATSAAFSNSIVSRLQARNRSTIPRAKNVHKDALGDLVKLDQRKGLESKLRQRLTTVPLEADSIFGEEVEKVAGMTEEEAAVARQRAAESKKTATKVPKSLMGASLVKQHMRNVVDPDPRSRLRWERKMVIRHVTRALDFRAGETKQERIKRTERELLSKSPWIATSYKKLGMLARQIAGKTLAEAKLQMKMSRKKHAAEVLYQLDLARDTAIVERGMGLGRFNGEYEPEKAEKKRIRDHRNGKWVDIQDPTRMYVDEVWVNRGPWRGKKPNFRARGRVDIIQMPQASRLRIDYSLFAELMLTSELFRYLYPSQGRENKITTGRGEEGEGGKERTLASPARQAHYGSTSVLHLVNGPVQTREESALRLA